MSYKKYFIYILVVFQPMLQASLVRIKQPRSSFIKQGANQNISRKNNIKTSKRYKNEKFKSSALKNIVLKENINNKLSSLRDFRKKSSEQYADMHEKDITKSNKGFLALALGLLSLGALDEDEEDDLSDEAIANTIYSFEDLLTLFEKLGSYSQEEQERIKAALRQKGPTFEIFVNNFEDTKSTMDSWSLGRIKRIENIDTENVSWWRNPFTYRKMQEINEKGAFVFLLNNYPEIKNQFDQLLSLEQIYTAQGYDTFVHGQHAYFTFATMLGTAFENAQKEESKVVDNYAYPRIQKKSWFGIYDLLKNKKYLKRGDRFIISEAIYTNRSIVSQSEDSEKDTFYDFMLDSKKFAYGDDKIDYTDKRKKRDLSIENISYRAGISSTLYKNFESEIQDVYREYINNKNNRAGFLFIAVPKDKVNDVLFVADRKSRHAPTYEDPRTLFDNEELRDPNTNVAIFPALGKNMGLSITNPDTGIKVIPVTGLDQKEEVSIQKKLKNLEQNVREGLRKEYTDTMQEAQKLLEFSDI